MSKMSVGEQGQDQDDFEMSHEMRVMKRMQIVYSRQTRERRIFMDELKHFRKRRERYLMKTIRAIVGPAWYHVLSENQRNTLNEFKSALYQDTLEGRPIRTTMIIQQYGLYPQPSSSELMNCVYASREDPQEMLAQMFLTIFGHTIDVRRVSYSLNGKLILSGIFYLGMDNLIQLLRKRFRPDQEKPPKKCKEKPKPKTPAISPYLEEMIVPLWVPSRPKRKPPAPLPNLDDLNEPIEEEAVMTRMPPPPPPPPPPKKRLARSYCDKLAGVINIEPHSSCTALTCSPKRNVARSFSRRVRSSRLLFPTGRQSYGRRGSGSKRNAKKRKPKAPDTGFENACYNIIGVFQVRGRTVYMLGGITIIPPEGDLIHGGFALLDGGYINVHCGYRGPPPEPLPIPCDCLKLWQNPVLDYATKTKCTCGHYYDFRNEGKFTDEHAPFFHKATRYLPFQFDYKNIFELDEKRMHVEKEFKKLWDTDSVLHVSVDGDKSKEKKKKKNVGSNEFCLGTNPKPEDYLKCALRKMKRDNIAARLPDIHLAPELKEWMRYRIYGPMTREQKAGLISKSNTYWQLFLSLYLTKGYGHVNPRKDPRFNAHTTWIHKSYLNKEFDKHSHRYRLEFYRSQANVLNLFWATMFQAQVPDKKFREIFFSYLSSRLQDITMIHPYNEMETIDRARRLNLRRVVCRPKGADDLNAG